MKRKRKQNVSCLEIVVEHERKREMCQWMGEYYSDYRWNKNRRKWRLYAFFDLWQSLRLMQRILLMMRLQARLIGMVVMKMDVDGERRMRVRGYFSKEPTAAPLRSRSGQGIWRLPLPVRDVCARRWQLIVLIRTWHGRY